MGLRFQKRVQLFPGVRLNFSRSGVSATIGVQGASVTVARDGVYANLGLPGSGLSYRDKIASFPKGGSSATQGASRLVPSAALRGDQPRGTEDEPVTETGFAPSAFSDDLPSSSGMAQAVESDLPPIASAPTERLASAGLAELHQLIIEAGEQRRALKAAITEQRQTLKQAETELARVQAWWRKLFLKSKIPPLQETISQAKAELADLNQTLADSSIDLDLDLTPPVLDAFVALARSFEDLRTSQRIWDITHQRNDGRLDGQDIERRSVIFTFADSALLKCRMRAMMFGNANGSDMHVYPMFILMRAQGDDFALIDPRDIVISYEAVSFVEDQDLPSDARVVGEGWEKVTKSGERDRRFGKNRSLPTVLYGALSVYSRAGLNERWLISNAGFAERFARAWAAYQRVLPPLEGQGYFGSGIED